MVGIGFAVGRHLHQALQQVGGIALDAAHARCAHQGRDKARHDDAIFDHVGNAARRAHVIFQHVEAAVDAAHEIDSRDGDEVAQRRLDADGGAAKLRASQDEIARDDAVRQDAAVAVNVGDERVERADALNQAGFERCPGVGVDDARNGIEREDSLGAVGGAVDVEGHAHAAEHPVGARADFCELRRRHREHRLDDGGASASRLARKIKHLVEDAGVGLVRRPKGHRLACFGNSRSHRHSPHRRSWRGFQHRQHGRYHLKSNRRARIRREFRQRSARGRPGRRGWLRADAHACRRPQSCRRG